MLSLAIFIWWVYELLIVVGLGLLITALVMKKKQG